MAKTSCLNNETEETLLERTTVGKRYRSYASIAQHFDAWANGNSICGGLRSGLSYSPFSHSYEEDVERFHYHAPEKLAALVLSSVQNHEDMKTVLDVGCGTGLVGLQFFRKGYIVDGIDISEDMMRYAQIKKYRNLTLHNIATTPLETTVRYDAAVSVGVAGEYVPADCAARNILPALQEKAVVGVAGAITKQGTKDLRTILRTKGFQETHFHRGFGYQHAGITPIEYAYMVFTRGI